MGQDLGTVITGVLDGVVSHAMTLGLFERVNQHEPKNAPGRGLTAAIWVDTVAPIPAGSGLAVTTGILTLRVRLYTSMLAEPADMIDPTITAAVGAPLSAYSGDFDLGGQIRNVDLLGATGRALSAQAGYLNQDGRLLRIMDITLPCIINDLWDQVN